MRIAHIIITHKNPSQLERLLRKMQHSNFDFYIHVDKKVDISEFSHLADIPGVNFIEDRIVCNWGGYSTLRAMVNSLKEVLNREEDYGYYNLLSAQDYPLKSNEEIYDFFLNHKTNSFVYYETRHDSDWWQGAVNRFEKYHLTDFNFKGKSSLERIINSVLPRRKFPVPMELFGGSKSSWWMLNREAASYVTEFLKKGNELDRFLKFCWGTDEFVIPTILMNSPLSSSIVNNNYRYIHFPEGMANPKILGMEDYSKMLSSSMLFARKFDTEVSTEVLDKIDERV